MTRQDILRYVDHTLLSQTSTEDEIRTLCDDGIKYKCASVCIPNTHIKYASEYVCGRIKICAVIGFPLGYSTTATKCFEAEQAIKDGADEVDMVANICRIREGRYKDVLEDIKAV